MIPLPNAGDADPNVDNVRVMPPVEVCEVVVNGFDTGLAYAFDGEVHSLSLRNCAYGFHNIDDLHQAVRLVAKAIAIERGFAHWPQHPGQHWPPRCPPFGGAFIELGGDFEEPSDA